MRKLQQKSVKIVEVGPRDGLQNEKKIIGTEEKLQFILKLAQAGLKNIEVTSFVRSEKIPQMKDAKELFSLVREKITDKKMSLPCLVPNLKGLELAKSLGVKEVAFFTATSDEFNKKNINMTVDESLTKMEALFAEAQRAELTVRIYISTVFGCPYQGKMGGTQLKKILSKIRAWGECEISLGDTIGVATPPEVDKILTELKKDFDFKNLAMHFHDTRGMALANALVSLEHGIEIFDSSAAGLGGCPYAKGATGNVATEDLVYLFHSFGIKTGIDFPKLAEASQYILSVLGKETTSKYLTSYFKTGKE